MPLGIRQISLNLLGARGILLIACDDAFPLFLGGNKARKMVKISNDIQKKGCNAVVTTGGIQSNHCRVTALACAEKGWECMLILHGSQEKFLSQKGNALIMRICGARFEFVSPENIGTAMDKAMSELRERGLSPYYLAGGGHNEPGVQAYVEAVHELKDALPSGYNIDNIFMASGTGSTQAGIIAGCREVGWTKTKVHGISVSRFSQRGIDAILEALSFIRTDLGIFSESIIFYDDFLFDGYGKSNSKLYNMIIDVARKTGLVLDETYSGKAFWGMLEIIKQEKLYGNNLFWNTGGVLNIMA
jgi:D-cysteine desulfhydrase